MVNNLNEYEFKLPVESVEELKRLEKSIKITRKQIQALKGTGIDVSVIEDKLDWAEETGKILLKEFS
jgi:hypothetical protein